MFSSASPDEAGPVRHGEKKRMRCGGEGAVASPEPSTAAMASHDHCSSRNFMEYIDGATTPCRRWHPGESQRPEIDDAPIFTPTEEEFKDAIGYIASICPQAERYGICRIIPPSSWKPPCPLKEKSFWKCTEFNTRVQQVDKLQNREPTKKRTQPRVQRKRKRRKRLRFGMTHRRPTSSADSEEKFGFQSGSDFTLEEFQKYADEFKQEYFGMKGSDEISISEIKNHMKIWEPSVEEIEGEYWRIVVGPTDEVEVDYGADLDTATFGSGFVKLSSSDGNKQDPYGVSCWNLNNLPRLPGSVISFEDEDISGVVVPWLYVGMCFSSFCWVTQLCPSVLKSEGVSVYRAVQKSGEFVLTLPRAYHSGFNCGFNCAEAVNVAPVDWLPHGQCAVELYRDQHRKTSISHDKLLLKAAKEAITQLWMNLLNCKSGKGEYIWLNTCGKDGVLTSAIKTRVKMEGAAWEANVPLKSKKMDKEYDSIDRECFSCFYDLHLSAVSCQCTPNRFACLNHTNLLCSCGMDRKITLFRYSMEELNTLVAALEGDLAAVCCWGQDHLGLVCQFGSLEHRKMDSCKSTEFSGLAIDANLVSGFGGNQNHCHDLQKPAGFQQEKGIQNNCLNLNIEDPPCSSRIKEHGKDRMILDHRPLQKTDSPFRATSECSSSLSLNCSANLHSPSRNQASNTKKLFGVDIGNSAKHSDGQVGQMVMASGRFDAASRPISRHQVEPLDYGMVMIGKNWFNNQAIFPKGFRSRVSFYNIQDPIARCFYVSEVLDAGPLGPLFKVTLEQVPDVSFTHTSPMSCWDSVRDKVNEEIENLQRNGKFGVPSFLPPDSVNGLEMFGFLSPQIVQEIEALDPSHQCLDYWLSKAASPAKELPSDSTKSAVLKCSSNSYVRLLGVEIAKESENGVCSSSCVDEVILEKLPKKAKLPDGQETNRDEKVFCSSR